jgi:hypothetical protein
MEQMNTVDVFPMNLVKGAKRLTHRIFMVRFKFYMMWCLNFTKYPPGIFFHCVYTEFMLVDGDDYVPFMSLSGMIISSALTTGDYVSTPRIYRQYTSLTSLNISVRSHSSFSSH